MPRRNRNGGSVGQIFQIDEATDERLAPIGADEPRPITATSWAIVKSCTQSKTETNGAEAGKRYWFRVAGVNAKGQGPWCEPAARPVM